MSGRKEAAKKNIYRQKKAKSGVHVGERKAHEKRFS